MDWIDKVLSVNDNLVIVHTVVDDSHIVVSCPGVCDNDTAWQDMGGYDAFKCGSIASGNNFKPASSCCSFNNAHHPAPSPAPATVVLR